MKLAKLESPNLQWSSESIPLSETFDDYYYSTDGAVEESSYVFIKHNDLKNRFEQACSNSETADFRIAETGFGTGLNFLLTMQLWFDCFNPIKPQAGLHFISFEKFPLTVEELAQAHEAYPELARFAKELRQHYPLRLPGWHDVWLFNGQVRLTLWFGDVLTGLPELDASAGSKVDAWFLDGFTPAKNPEMWQPSLYQQMARLSHATTTFATFTSAGDVRRGLQKVGFEVKKASGWGKKREMCFGGLQHLRPTSLKAPWFSRPDPITTGEAIVVGAGLAGASVAYKLAEAGWKVTVLEAEKQPALHASGNLAGTVHPLITADWNLRSQWYLQGFEVTLRTLLPWLENSEVLGDLTGLVQLAVTEVGATRVQEALRRVGLPENFAYEMTQHACSERVGQSVSTSGLYFPQGGWINPPSVVQRCLNHPNIDVEYQQAVQSFVKQQTHWQVTTASKELVADCVVIATGALNAELNQQLGLPIRPVKGQVSHLTAQQQTSQLNCAVLHEGYSSPCGEGVAVSGATFEAPDMSLTLSVESHQKNLEITQSALPNWLETTAQALTGRVAFRPTTPDHLPIIGPVADPEWMQQAYLDQSHTHAVYRYPQQQYQAGLFVSNGHGARGLMSVFLAAESIVADLQGTPLLQPLSLYHASHPARFKIRQWRSGKTVTGRNES
ncbi:MAG: bifunctional tRNA (5-methylaminomethyl-2-thiouridine)(34)-methyltransferase MnmD/FAD-dependent 5-carboxymethylaminomethyl-2-thiouridine(34) oxidoreductase MnmC [Pseudomonadota bacterium]|nr:bifunctional tRNA (5-methylaminomethyl-2-thiouridine)(34)-methyltransferase MnmD/FAD-dependent 5-carboxymethylaminomethyl-2-thiouridine(34) oxidoreductase MnmC [Pseudomonadota bacterium]